MTPKPEECEVCGRPEVASFYGAHGGGRCSANANQGDAETCWQLGYERRGVEITVLRAELRDWQEAHGLGLYDKPLIDPAAEARVRALEDALRDDIAWVNGMMCPECGVEMTPDHDTQAAGDDGYANEECCQDARARRTAMQAILDATLARAEGQKEGT